MNQIKEASNTILNQLEHNSKEIQSNVLAFQKKAVQQNPFNSMTFHWQIAQMRKNFVFWSTLPMSIFQTYIDTFNQVYNPEGKK